MGAELYFLDADFDLIAGPVEGFTSIVFSERYHETGTFSLRFPASLLPSIADAVYVRTAADPETGECLAGRIETLSSVDAENGGCEMGGPLLECLLEDRLTEGAFTDSGEATAVVLRTVTANLRSSPVEVDADGSAVIGESGTFGGEWENLGAWVRSVLRPYGASYAIRLRESGGALVPVFRVIRGQDRSAEGSAQRAVFSGSYGNIFSVTVERDLSGVKNAVFVEGGDGVVEVVDHSAGAPARRELYRRASDLKRADFDTEAAYRAALALRGEMALAHYPEGLCVSAECDPDALPVYGRDYALGDVCDVADERLGLSFGLRLTGVDTVWEGGGRLLCPFFGDEVLSVRETVRRMRKDG